MLRLIKPNISYEKELLAYRKSFTDTIHGSSQLANYESIQEWLDHLKRSESEDTCGLKRVPATTFILVNEKNEVLGMSNVRHKLNEYLKIMGGHIGYSVKEEHRRKGYAKYILKESLEFCRSLGIKRVLVTANDDNTASYKTIEANGGVLENKVYEEDGQCVRRYWINLI